MIVYVYFPCFKPPPMPKTISTNLKIVNLCIVSLFHSSSTAFVKISPAARASWLMSWIRT